MRFDEVLDDNDDDDEWAAALVQAARAAEEEEWDWRIAIARAQRRHSVSTEAPLSAPRVRPATTPPESAAPRAVSRPRKHPPVFIPPKDGHDDSGDLLRAAFAAYVDREERARK